MTTTTLVHRVYNGPAEWWRQGLVYEVGAPQMGAEDLESGTSLLDHVSSLGLDAVLVRPSLLDPATDLAAFRSFTDEAHARGLRVIVRVSGAQDPVTGARALDEHPIVTGVEPEGEGLLERAGSFLSSGADGIDLGTLVPPEVARSTDLERLSEYVAVLQGLVAEYIEDGVIGADVSTSYPETMLHHLQDDWLHHLRDDSLTLTRWDRDSITRHLTRSLNEHDRFGAAPAWRYLPSHLLIDGYDPGDGLRWFATERQERSHRSLAMQTLMLALPGSVYLRQGDEVGMLDEDKPSSPTDLARAVSAASHPQGSQLGSPLATVRHATHERRSHSLATAPLAFVDGLSWCPQEALTFLTRDVLVLVNTTREPVALPDGALVLLSSQALEQTEGHVLVPTSTTVWLIAGSVA